MGKILAVYPAQFYLFLLTCAIVAILFHKVPVYGRVKLRDVYLLGFFVFTGIFAWRGDFYPFSRWAHYAVEPSHRHVHHVAHVVDGAGNTIYLDQRALPSILFSLGPSRMFMRAVVCPDVGQGVRDYVLQRANAYADRRRRGDLEPFATLSDESRRHRMRRWTAADLANIGPFESIRFTRNVMSFAPDRRSYTTKGATMSRRSFSC